MKINTPKIVGGGGLELFKDVLSGTLAVLIAPSLAYVAGLGISTQTPKFLVTNDSLGTATRTFERNLPKTPKNTPIIGEQPILEELARGAETVNGAINNVFAGKLGAKVLPTLKTANPSQASSLLKHKTVGLNNETALRSIPYKEINPAG